MLFDYNYWANTRVLDAAASITLDQFIAPASLSHGSVRGTLAHVLAAETVWRLRCAQGVSPAALPDESYFPTLGVLRERWQVEEEKMREYLNGLTDGALQQTIEYRTTKGVPYQNVLWMLLVHIVNHGTQFRSEAAVALTNFGQSPGDLDLLRYLREKAI